MTIKTKHIEIISQKQLEFIDITEQARQCAEEAGIVEGQLLIFAPHTTGSVMLNHNEPMLLSDLQRILYRLVPIDERYSHDMFELSQGKKSDGRSNAHSHCKNMILGTDVTIPIEKGALLLGEKQSVFFVEFDGGRTREIIFQVLGE